MDRDAITEYMKKNIFKTIIGDVDIRSQKLTRYWTVGQWQDGFFHARQWRRASPTTSRFA